MIKSYFQYATPSGIAGLVTICTFLITCLVLLSKSTVSLYREYAGSKRNGDGKNPPPLCAEHQLMKSTFDQTVTNQARMMEDQTRILDEITGHGSGDPGLKGSLHVLNIKLDEIKEANNNQHSNMFRRIESLEVKVGQSGS